MSLETYLSLLTLLGFFIVLPAVIYIVIPYWEIRQAIKKAKAGKFLTKKDQFALLFYSLFQEGEKNT